MKKSLLFVYLTLSLFSSQAQGNKLDNISFPTEWLKYEFYEHQLFFALQTQDFFKQELKSGNGVFSIKTYQTKGKVHTWTNVTSFNDEGFIYNEGEKQKTIYFEDVVDWKITRNNAELGNFTKSQIIELDNPNTQYSDLLRQVMNNFYEWKYIKGIRGIRGIQPTNQKQAFKVNYDIENFDSLKSRNLEVKTEVDYNPQFPGGIYWMHKYINQKIDLKKLINYGYEPVYIRFVVGTDGTIKDIAIVKGEINLDMDELVAKMVYDMPKWIPAVKDEKPVEATCYLPIYFD